MSETGKPANEFLAEAADILDGLSKDLLSLDARRGEEADAEQVNGIFRGFHSLKGLCGLFSQAQMTELAHHAEELLDRVRLGKVALSDAVLDALLATVDVFGVLLRTVARGRKDAAAVGRARAMAKRLGALANEDRPVPADEPLDALALDPSLRTVFTEYEEHRLRESLRRGVALWRARATFSVTDFDQKLAGLTARLKGLGEVVSTLPGPGAGDASIAFDVLFACKASVAEIAAALEGENIQLEPLATGPGPKGVLAAPRSTGLGEAGEDEQALEGAAADPEARDAGYPQVRDGEGALKSVTQTVRVDIGRLDALMNAVGELLLIKGNLQRLAEQARSTAGLPRAWGQELGHETQTLHRRLDELQKGILDARMVPLSQVFDRLARLVRRVVREVGKELDLSLLGGEVELDKLIVEELSDPLMHLLHNAIDHGVEPPEVREKAGKPRKGSILLRARQIGNHVVIEVRDDGAGLDDRRIRDVAIAKGLVTSVQAAEMGRRDVLNLIFQPGFSTARSVSELSGRGVGLDVVKTNIANLSGIIDVTSEPGHGTTFTLTLPVTLAIIRALVVAVSGRVYAVPLNSVLEILSMDERDVRTVERREVVAVRGATLPLSRLARMFRLPEQRQARSFVVVVGLAQKRLGIVVDDVQGQQDIVIKPLGGRLSHIPGLAGATDLGNRRTVLVLDVGALMDEVVSPERHTEFF